jgi:hypothetical protein
MADEPAKSRPAWEMMLNPSKYKTVLAEHHFPRTINKLFPIKAHGIFGTPFQPNQQTISIQTT